MDQLQAVGHVALLEVLERLQHLGQRQAELGAVAGADAPAAGPAAGELDAHADRPAGRPAPRRDGRSLPAR